MPDLSNMSREEKLQFLSLLQERERRGGVSAQGPVGPMQPPWFQRAIAPDAADAGFLTSLKSVGGGFASGASLGLFEPFKESPIPTEELRPGYEHESIPPTVGDLSSYQIGRGLGIIAPWSLAYKGVGALAGGLTSKLPGFLARFATGAGAGGAIGTVEQTGRAIKGEGFDPEAVGLEAGIFGTLDAALFGLGRGAKLIRNLYREGKYAKAANLYKETVEEGIKRGTLKDITAQQAAETEAVIAQGRLQVEKEVAARQFSPAVGTRITEAEIAQRPFRGRVTVPERQGMAVYPEPLKTRAEVTGAKAPTVTVQQPLPSPPPSRTVAELKVELTKAGLSTKGNKPELTARLAKSGGLKKAGDPGTLLYSGYNPMELAGWIRRVAQSRWGGRYEEGGRKLVNILGTPEVVLEGRGIVEPFQREYELMRVHREELGSRLGKIFGKIKRKSSEDRAIFDALDDPNAVLAGNQGELRELFDELLKEINIARTARGQPLIERRKGYITHLLDYSTEQGKLFKDLHIPKKLRFRFEKRKGGGKYKKSAIESAEVYVEAALRDIHVGNALHEAVPNINKLSKFASEPLLTTKTVTKPDGTITEQTYYNFGRSAFGTERAYAEEFVKRQLGWPSWLEKVVHNALGVKPHTQRVIGQGITAMYYRSLIGAALDTSVKNLTQGVNTLGEFGVWATMKGYGSMVTKKGWQTAKREHLLDEFEPLLHGGETIKLSGKVGKVLKAFDDYVLAWPMRTAEVINRGVTFHAAFENYIKSGMSIEAAHDAARSAVRKVQFGYGKANISPYVQSAPIRPLFQFFSFPQKQVELMYKWATENPNDKSKLLRYFATTGALVMGGKYADVDLSNIFMDPFKAVDPTSKKGFKLPGSEKRVEFSFEKLIRSGFIPQGPAPVISAPQKFMKSQLSEDEYTRERGRVKGLEMVIPGGRYGAKVGRAYSRFQGEPITGRRERIIRKPSKKDIGLYLVGLRTGESEIEWSEREEVRKVENYYYEQRQKFIDNLIAGEKEDAKKIFNELREEYPFLMRRFVASLDMDAIMAEAIKKKQTSEQRFYTPSIRQEIRRGINR